MSTTITTTQTPTDPLREEWALNDDVIRLRAWGSDRVFWLSPDQPGALIGSAPTCAIQVQDRTRRTSRQHAQLQRVQGRWVVIDRSKNGLYRDGARLDRFILTPGVEIGLGGGATLIAESSRLMVLRGALARMLGWSAASAEEVDLALRAIRFTAQRRMTLVLCGMDPLPLAEELHRLTLGPARPFVYCNPRRRTSELRGNRTKCVGTGRAALDHAAGGTICLTASLPPPDLTNLMREIRLPRCQAQLVVCAERATEAQLYNAAPIVIPPLVARRNELDRIIQEYASEAGGPLELGEHWLTEAERAWMRNRLSTLAQIQKATIRLAAIRRAGSMTAGAARLGMSHVGMLKWLRTYKFPTKLLPTKRH
jgi:FHA domain